MSKKKTLREQILSAPDCAADDTPEEMARADSQARAILAAVRSRRDEITKAMQKLIPGWRYENSPMDWARRVVAVCRSAGIQPSEFARLPARQEIFYIRAAAEMAERERATTPKPNGKVKKPRKLTATERQKEILIVVKNHAGNMSAAARELGLSRPRVSHVVNAAKETAAIRASGRSIRAVQSLGDQRDAVRSGEQGGRFAQSRKGLSDDEP